MAPLNFVKSKIKSKHRNTATGSFAKADGKAKQQQQRSMTTMMAANLDFQLKMEIGAFGSGQSCSTNKYDSTGRHIYVKEEPISDTEARNNSESDTDSENEKKKFHKKSSHEKSGSKKSDKSQKSRKSTDKLASMDAGCLLHEHPAISDENSNDSSHNFTGVKSEAYHKANVKSELIAGSNTEQHQQRDEHEHDGGGHAANATGNLDKSSSSVEEFDNEQKPSRVIKVSINLDYDSEVYNDEVNIRRFHKYQRNMEIENTLQVTSFDSSNIITAPVQTPLPPPAGSGGIANIAPIVDQFPYESAMLDCNMQLQLQFQQQQQLVYSSSDSESDDSDANDLDDSENSSCDECATGPCSTSVLPLIQNLGSPTSSPAMSMYNKNGRCSPFPHSTFHIPHHFI